MLISICLCNIYEIESRVGAETSLLDWMLELFRYYWRLGARGNLLNAPPPPAREEPAAALSGDEGASSAGDADETVDDSGAEADAAYIAGQHASREGSRPVTPPPMSPIAEEPPAGDESDAPIPTATPATDALAAESISLAVWALDASKAVEKPEPIPAPQPRRHGHRWLLRTIVFVTAACATFLALAPRPALASVVAPVACWAGLEVCGVCGPTCDAVCTH